VHVLRIAVTLLVLAAPHAQAGRPVTYANSTTLMAEYGEGTMQEAQVFYAPHSFLSFGLGHMRLEGHGLNQGDDITYARVNFLVKRWNLNPGRPSGCRPAKRRHRANTIMAAAAPWPRRVIATRFPPTAGTPARKSTSRRGSSTR
jgi:hypothetical protein